VHRALECRRVVVDAGDEQQPDLVQLARRRDLPDGGEHVGVVRAGEPSVDVGIERLQVEHDAVGHRQQPGPDVGLRGAIAVDEPGQPGQSRIVPQRREERTHERRLQRGLATGDGDAGEERRERTHLLDEVGHLDGPRARRVLRDRVRVVAGEAVQVAALQERDEPVARPVHPREPDDVSEQTLRLPQRSSPASAPAR
jgi:hypothetical protein